MTLTEGLGPVEISQLLHQPLYTHTLVVDGALAAPQLTGEGFRHERSWGRATLWVRDPVPLEYR